MNILLILLSILPLVSLFTPGLPVTHDGQDHVARIANFYSSLSEGNVIPRWGGNLNWGYGHPVLMFLYPLPSYAASLFHVFGFSFVDSTKFVFAVSYIASILLMYLWVRNARGKTAGLTASVLYGFAPYRFVDLYVRGAIGEHMAFVFPPLIAYGLYVLSRGKRRMAGVYSTAFGTAALILSHNALSLLFLSVLFVYALYLLRYEAKSARLFVISAASGVVFGFMLSAFFWVPAFFEGKYTLRDIVTADPITDRFVPLMHFLYSSWNYGGSATLSKWLGAAQLFAVALGFYAVFSRRKAGAARTFVAGGLVILSFSVILMTRLSEPVWNTVTILQKFQFPWRLLSVSTFVVPLIGAAAIAVVPKNSRRVLATFIILVSVLATVHMWKPLEYRTYDESFFTGIYNSTTDTGESSPVWSVRFMELRPLQPLEAADGDADIDPVLRTSARHVYRVQTDAYTRLVENTLYFPGWHVYVDGVEAEIQFQDPQYRGLMTFAIPPGSHSVLVEFRETKLRLLADMISLVSIIVLMSGTALWLWRQKRIVYR